MKVIYPANFSHSRNETILNYCRGKRVLHVGACDAPFTEKKYSGGMGPLLYREIDRVCSSQLGVDLDNESISFLASKKNEFPNSEIKFFDMNKLEDLTFEPEVVLFGEVIEHLMNIEIALTNLKKVMKKDTFLIISTPNAFYVSNFIRALLRFENMHEDHKVLFSYGYIKNLLQFNRISVEQAYFTFLDRNEDLSFLQRGIKLLIHSFCSLFPGTSETLLIITKISPGNE